MEKKLQKPYLTNYNLLIAQDLCQTHYQIFLIILLKEFIKSNANMEMIIKNVKRGELNTTIVSKVDLIIYKCLICDSNSQIKFDQSLKKRFNTTIYTIQEYIQLFLP